MRELHQDLVGIGDDGLGLDGFEAVSAGEEGLSGEDFFDDSFGPPLLIEGSAIAKMDAVADEWPE